jgi:plastocyanin domain-containing protein
MIAFITSKIKRSKLLFKYVSVTIIVILSIGFISRGITCIRTGDIDKISSDKMINEEKQEDIILTINNSYKVSKNEIKVGTKVIMNFEVINYNHCTHLFYIVTPDDEKFEINLDKNHDSITFTPKTVGTITITCFMNMKKTTIEVVN